MSISSDAVIVGFYEAQLEDYEKEVDEFPGRVLHDAGGGDAKHADHLQQL